eukprot:Clim_evm33s218 gene=Clim_evmTU33s218
MYITQTNTSVRALTSVLLAATLGYVSAAEVKVDQRCLIVKKNTASASKWFHDPQSEFPILQLDWMEHPYEVLVVNADGSRFIQRFDPTQEHYANDDPSCCDLPTWYKDYGFSFDTDLYIDGDKDHGRYSCFWFAATQYTNDGSYYYDAIPEADYLKVDDYMAKFGVRAVYNTPDAERLPGIVGVNNGQWLPTELNANMRPNKIAQRWTKAFSNETLDEIIFDFSLPSVTSHNSVTVRGDRATAVVQESTMNATFLSHHELENGAEAMAIWLDTSAWMQAHVEMSYIYFDFLMHGDWKDRSGPIWPGQRRLHMLSKVWNHKAFVEIRSPLCVHLSSFCRYGEGSGRFVHDIVDITSRLEYPEPPYICWCRDIEVCSCALDDPYWGEFEGDNVNWEIYDGRRDCNLVVTTTVDVQDGKMDEITGLEVNAGRSGCTLPFTNMHKIPNLIIPDVEQHIDGLRDKNGPEFTIEIPITEGRTVFEFGEDYGIDCITSEWSEWSGCDDACLRNRTREVLFENTGNGAECGDLLEEDEEFCEPDKDCALHCTLGDWSDWGICEESCEQTRTREIIEQFGPVCPDRLLSDTRDCFADECISYCEMTEWSEWDPCGPDCTQTRARSILNLPLNTPDCPSELVDERVCSDGLCPGPIDCEAGEEFLLTGTCNLECQLPYSRQIEREANVLGQNCTDLQKADTCDSGTCQDGDVFARPDRTIKIIFNPVVAVPEGAPAEGTPELDSYMEDMMFDQCVLQFEGLILDALEEDATPFEVHDVVVTGVLITQMVPARGNAFNSTDDTLFYRARTEIEAFMVDRTARDDSKGAVEGTNKNANIAKTEEGAAFLNVHTSAIRSDSLTVDPSSGSDDKTTMIIVIVASVCGGILLIGGLVFVRKYRKKQMKKKLMGGDFKDPVSDSHRDDSHDGSEFDSQMVLPEPAAVPVTERNESLTKRRSEGSLDELFANLDDENYRPSRSSGENRTDPTYEHDTEADDWWEPNRARHTKITTVL